MKRNARKAFDALKKEGATVIETRDYGAHFIISGENNYPVTVADYWQEYMKEYVDDNGKIQNAFGIATFVHDILQANGLYAEWIDGGTVGVYDA